MIAYRISVRKITSKPRVPTTNASLKMSANEARIKDSYKTSFSSFIKPFPLVKTHSTGRSC